MKLTEIDSQVALNVLGYRTGSELLFYPPTTDRWHYFPKEHWKLLRQSWNHRKKSKFQKWFLSVVAHCAT